MKKFIRRIWTFSLRGRTGSPSIQLLASMGVMVKSIKHIASHIVARWVSADGFGLSAALSFYAMFSLAPIIVFALLLASHFLGENSARAGAKAWLEGFLSNDEAADLIGLVHIQDWKGQSLVVTCILILTFLWAASLFFVRLRVSVNRLLDCTAPTMKQAVKNSLIGRVHALLFTLGSGVIMAMAIGMVTMMGSLGSIFAAKASFVIWLSVRASAVVITVVASLIIYRLLPLRPPSWKGTWAGIGFLVLAFELARVLLNLYLQHSWITSAYGAANTLVVFLIWIYYTSQVLLLGVTLAGAMTEGSSKQEK